MVYRTEGLAAAREIAVDQREKRLFSDAWFMDSKGVMRPLCEQHASLANQPGVQVMPARDAVPFLTGKARAAVEDALAFAA